MTDAVSKSRDRSPHRLALDAQARARRGWLASLAVGLLGCSKRARAAAGLRAIARRADARRRQRALATASRTMPTSASIRAAQLSPPRVRAASAQFQTLASAASMRRISALSSGAAGRGAVAR